MRIADTSALYAFFHEADPHHAEAVERVASDEPILVPTEILVETIDLIAYRFGHAAGRKALGDLMRLPHVALAERVHLEPVRALHEASKGKLSLADAFVVQTCRVTGASAFSFDREVLKATE